MLKRISRILFPIIAFLMVGSIVLASSWLFRFPTTVTDTSHATRTYYPVILGYSGQSLINSGKMTASGLDTNMQIGTMDTKYMISTAKVLSVIPSLTANGSQRLDLYTGYAPAATNFPIITGNNGYVTVSDNADIEPAGNFTAEYSGYIDTSNATALAIFDKTAGVTTNGTRLFAQSGNITGQILTTTSAILYVLPSSNGTYADAFPNISSASPAVDHWNNVKDPVGAPDDMATRVYTNSESYQSDSYNGTATSVFLGIGQEVTNVSIHTRTVRSAAGGELSSVVPSVILGGAEVAGATINPPDLLTGGVWTSYTSSNITRPGGGSWTTADFTPNTLQIGLGVVNVAGTTITYITQIYVEVDYTYLSAAASVTSNVTSAAHVVKMPYDGANLKLYIDDMVTPVATTAWVGTVPDNTNNLILMSNSTPYMDYFKWTVGGVEKIKYQPNTILNGAVVVNLDSGGSYPGTITWGTNTSLTLTYAAMESFSPTSAIVSQTGGFSLSNSGLPSTWFSSGENLSGLPFYDSFSAAASSSGMPVDTIYTVIAVGLAIFAFILVTGYTRSAFLGSLSMIIVLFISSSMTIIPMWIAVAVMITDFGIMFIYRQVSY